MPTPNPFIQALGDLVDDVAYHGVNLVQGAFDLVCVMALGATFYLASVEPSRQIDLQPALAAAQLDLVPASQTSLCLASSEAVMDPLGGCITALVLDDQLGT